MDNTFNDSKVLTTCKVNTLKCSNNDDDALAYFQYSAMRNDTFTWITVTPDNTESLEGSFIIACKSNDKVLHYLPCELRFWKQGYEPTLWCCPSRILFFTSQVQMWTRHYAKKWIKTFKFWGAGNNFTDLHECVYSIVDYDSFVASCQMTASGVKESCTFPTGIRINKQIMGNGVLF